MSATDQTTDPYTEAHCALPGCTEPLHLVWTGSRPVYLTDLADDADVSDMTDAYTATWRVECEAGHVLLLPDAEGLSCPCGSEECNGADAGVGHAGFDHEEIRTFRAVDAGRLRALLFASAGAR